MIYIAIHDPFGTEDLQVRGKSSEIGASVSNRIKS